MHGQRKKFEVTLTILCRPQLIESLLDEFTATADYENAEIISCSNKEIPDR